MHMPHTYLITYAVALATRIYVKVTYYAHFVLLQKATTYNHRKNEKRQRCFKFGQIFNTDDSSCQPLNFCRISIWRKILRGFSKLEFEAAAPLFVFQMVVALSILESYKIHT